MSVAPTHLAPLVRALVVVLFASGLAALASYLHFSVRHLLR
jgi:hypothetical protein